MLKIFNYESFDTVPVFFVLCMVLFGSPRIGLSQTITFEELPVVDSGPGCFNLDPGFSSEGFDFAGGVGSITASCDPDAGGLFVDNGTVTVGVNHVDPDVVATITMQRTDGTVFSVESFEGGELFAGTFVGSGAEAIEVTGMTVDGAMVQATFELDEFADGGGGMDDFQQFALPAGFTNLQQVAFMGLGVDAINAISLDNIVISSGSGGMLGDVNCDNEVNLLDVGPFVDLISSNEFLDKADINQDGAVNLLDVGPFVDLLSGG